MNNRQQFLISLFFTGVCLLSYACPGLAQDKANQICQAQTPAPNKLADQVKKAVHHTLAQWHPNANIGIVIEAMDSKKHRHPRVLYKKNAEHVFTPASTLKLFTATAALAELGPQFRFSTELRSQTKTVSKGRVLYSDIELVFGADPTLEAHDIEALIAHLKDYSINYIHGNIYINNQIFDAVAYGPGWMWDELNECYAASPSSVIIGKNCFDVELTPGAASGDVALLHLPQNFGVTPVINNVITHKKASNCSFQVKASTFNSYTISGCIGLHDSAKKISIAVKQPDRYARRLVTLFLKAQHITLQGKIIVGLPPKRLNKVMAAHYSSPLSALIKTMLKESDNLIAEALYRRIGVHYFHRQHMSWEDSARAVSAILSARTGIDFTRLHMADGSGLSRYDLIRPSQMAKLLRYIYNTPELYRVIFSSLPIAGVDGTLKHRLKHKAVPQQIHAKTGTMTSGSSLAGYVRTASGYPLAFVIEVNGFTENHKIYEALEDSLCLRLAQLH